MSSDTDSSTGSSSEEEYKKRKTSKKHKRKFEKKHKKEKKEKRHKHKKRARRECEEEVTPPVPIAPARRPHSTDDNDEEGSFGPALPPHLLQKQTAEEPKVIGPVMPSDFKIPAEQVIETNANKETTARSSDEEDEEDIMDTFGPLPITDEPQKMSSAQIELEQRALELKLAAIEGTSGNNVDQKVREEWMLELPEVGLKTGLAALANIKRTFHQGKERPDFSDRSSWTNTPQSEAQKASISTKAPTAEDLKSNAQAIYDRQRDDEQERMAKKHKKKHKRDESLVEIHQKKLRKEQRKKEKELAAAGVKPERRPFTRDVDLKLNKIDKNQTKQIVDKAKILNTKFSTGHTKYL